jgi:hypothetical protein
MTPPRGNSTGIQFTSEHTRYSFAPLQVKNILAKGSLTSGNMTSYNQNPIIIPGIKLTRGPAYGTFEFEMKIHNPNSSFVVPGAVSPAGQRKLPQPPSNASCKARWNPGSLAHGFDVGGSDLGGFRTFQLDASCQNGIQFTASYSRYNRTDQPIILSLSLSINSHMGLAGLGFFWTFQLYYPGSSPANGTLGHCDGDICTWDNFEEGANKIGYYESIVRRSLVRSDRSVLSWPAG